MSHHSRRGHAEFVGVTWGIRCVAWAVAGQRLGPTGNRRDSCGRSVPKRSPSRTTGTSRGAKVLVIRTTLSVAMVRLLSRA